MFCGKCGRKLEDGMQTCPVCEATINKKQTNIKFEVVKNIIISVFCLALVIICICFTYNTIYSAEYLHDWTIEYETKKAHKQTYENLLSNHSNDISEDLKVSISKDVKGYEYILEHHSDVVREGKERLKTDVSFAVCSGFLALGSGIVLIVSLKKSKKDKIQQRNT